MVSQEFWSKDGPYSWVILVTIVISRVAGITFVVTTTGVFADEYPRLFNVEQAQTNIIPSTLLGVLMFSGMHDFPICIIFYVKNEKSVFSQTK